LVAQGAFQDVQCFLTIVALGQNFREGVQGVLILRIQFDGSTGAVFSFRQACVVMLVLSKDCVGQYPPPINMRRLYFCCFSGSGFRFNVFFKKTQHTTCC